MKRTFNYTKRQRIDRRHVQIRLLESSPESASIDVGVDLTVYDFVSTARAYIEARGESAFERFELENPFDRLYHDRFELVDTSISSVTNFYLRVVEDGVGGRLLGLATDVKLTNPADLITERDALLPVEWADIGQEIWRMRYDESSGPTLLVSRVLQDNFTQISADPMFAGCIVPQAFRRVLEFALSDGDETDIDDSWFSEWHRWMLSLPGLSPLALRLEDELQRRDRIDEWIDESVDEFSKLSSNRFASKVSHVLSSRG